MVSHGGVGAAELRQRRCTGCQLEVNAADLRAFAAAAEDEVLRCEECSRILVRTAQSGPVMARRPGGSGRTGPGFFDEVDEPERVGLPRPPLSRRLIIEADGGSRGNPGPAAYGALVRDARPVRCCCPRG